MLVGPELWPSGPVPEAALMLCMHGLQKGAELFHKRVCCCPWKQPAARLCGQLQLQWQPESSHLQHVESAARQAALLGQ